MAGVETTFALPTSIPPSQAVTVVPWGTSTPSTEAVPWNTDGGAGGAAWLNGTVRKGLAKGVPDGPGTKTELDAVRLNTLVWPCCHSAVSFAEKSPILNEITFPAKSSFVG